MTITYPHTHRPSPQPVGVTLEAGATLDIVPPAEGLELAVRSGRVWITQTGDRNDYVLDADERFRTKRNGRVVVQALDSSTVALPTDANLNP